MLRNIVMALLTFIVFIIQTCFKQEITIGDVAPNLMLALICCIGFIYGKKPGMYCGFAAGLLIDLFYGYGGVIGLTAILLMNLGYVIGLFNEIFYSDDICIPVLLIVVSDLIYNFLYYCITFLLRGDLNLASYFQIIMFPEMIYTGFVSVFLYWFIKFLSVKIEKFEKRGEDKLVKGNFDKFD